jgi:hypothetical protein
MQTVKTTIPNGGGMWAVSQHKDTLKQNQLAVYSNADESLFGRKPMIACINSLRKRERSLFPIYDAFMAKRSLSIKLLINFPTEWNKPLNVKTLSRNADKRNAGEVLKSNFV